MQAWWMVAASLFFASMSVCIKFASAHFHTMELVAYRGAIGVVFMLVWCRAQRGSVTTKVPMMHVWRSIVGVASLNYMSGIWVAAFLVGGTLIMGRLQDIGRQGPVVLTMLAGFAGVVLVLRPTIEDNQMFAGLIGLLSGLGAAFAYLQVAALGRLGEPIVRTVLYFSIGATVAGSVGALFTGLTPWSWPHALWLLPIGVLAALGQLSMTRAYSHGATLVVANLQYAGIIFASLFGMIFFGDQIPLIGWAGMALIITSGIAATFLRARTLPNSPAEDH